MSRYRIRRITRDKFIELMLSGKSFYVKETWEGVRYKAIVRTEYYFVAHNDRRRLERKYLKEFGFPEDRLGGNSQLLAIISYEDARLSDCYGCTILSRVIEDFVKGTAKFYYRNRELRLID